MLTRLRSFLAVALSMLALARGVPLQAQDAAPEPAACDPSAIQWFLPGDFAKARATAERTGRLLAIKGISFGVDEVGARCATKGRW